MDKAVAAQTTPVTATEVAKFSLLIQSGLVSHEEVAAAVQEARKNGTCVESILVSRHRITKQSIGQSLSAFFQCPFKECDEKTSVPKALIESINPNYLRTNLWVPLASEGNTVHILMDDPRSPVKLQDIQHIFPGRNLRLHVGLREDILRLINRLGGTSDQDRPGSIEAILERLDENPQTDGAPAAAAEVEADEGDSDVVRLVNQIILDGHKRGASDIHIEPYLHKDTVVRFRVDGECSIYQKIPRRFRKALVSRLKIMAGLDIAERRKPQDGKIVFRLPESREIELRVAVIPTSADNEDVVLRLLASGDPKPLEETGFSKRNLHDLQLLLESPHGILLCAGPTGSGKTTTLHSSLWYLNGPDRKIWTAEDPVEITQYGLRQVQVNPKIGLTFAAALRAFLRADPDVIMIGEMRDQETAEIAIQAALTGHLVLSTLHTNSAVETVVRLLDMGVDPFSYADALLGVLSQRLVRTICPGCKESYRPPKDAFDAISHAFGEEAFAKLGAREDTFLLFQGKGCPACNQTGFKGRMGIHELLIVTDRVKSLIQGKASASELAEAAAAQGMATMIQDGIMKCLEGKTVFDQVRSAAMK